MLYNECFDSSAQFFSCSASCKAISYNVVSYISNDHQPKFGKDHSLILQVIKVVLNGRQLR